jgi:hypothetical protein
MSVNAWPLAANSDAMPAVAADTTATSRAAPAGERKST